MSFFDRLFKRENEKTSETRKKTLEAAERMVKEKIEEEQKSIEPELREFHSKLQEMNSKLRNSLQELDSAVPKDKMDEKLLFAAQTGRPTFKNKMIKVSQAITKPADFDFHSFSEYYNDCVFAVNQANALAITEFRTISIVFEGEAHSVVDELRKLKESLSGMGNKIKQHQQAVIPYEEILEKTAEMKKMLGELEDDKKKLQELNGEIEKTEIKVAETKNSILVFANSKEWREYEMDTERKRELKIREAEIRTKFNEFISSIERPMKKTGKIIDQSQEENEYKKYFDGYLENPFETYLSDEVNALTIFLGMTKKLLEERKIDINENVREKTIGKIDEWVSKGISGKLKEEYSSLMREIEKNDEEDVLPNKKAEMEKQVRYLEQEIFELKKKKETTEKKVEDEKKRIEEMKKEAEGGLKELSHNFELELNY